MDGSAGCHEENRSLDEAGIWRLLNKPSTQASGFNSIRYSGKFATCVNSFRGDLFKNAFSIIRKSQGQ